MGANNRGSQLATTLAKLPNAEIAYICDCEENAIAKGIAAATSNGGPAPKGIKDFRKALDDKHVDALDLRRPQPLARRRHAHRPRRRQARLLRKAGQPHRRRRRTHDRRREELRPRPPDRPPAPQQPALPRHHRQSPRRRNRQRPLCKVHLLQQPPLHRPRQTNRAARLARLRPLARPRHRRALPRQRHPLQLAPLLALGQLRSRQQRRPHDRHLPLGPRRRLPNESHRRPAASSATTTISKRPTRATSSPTSTAAARSSGKASAGRPPTNR